MTSAFWNLVLAGGVGRRLREVTGEVPKQFWSMDGRHTMVERTIERVMGLVPLERIATVIGPNQRRYTTRLVSPRALGHVIAQPVDRGTGMAVLLGLTAIRRHADDPIVLITPADHGVGCAAEFRTGVKFAVNAVETGRQQVVLFGVVPTEPASDYGWILPASSLHSSDRLFRSVRAFVEKPPAAEAARLLMAGGLWNTMVIVARASTLLQMFEARYPGLPEAVADLGPLGAGPDPALLASLLPSIDFSHDIVSPTRGLAVYTWPDTLGWSDLGTPERLRRWQQAS